MDSETLKHLVQKRTTFELSQLNTKLLLEAECWERVLVVPNNFCDRTSYLADVLVQMVCRPKDDDLRYVVGQLTQSLCYLLNSASWREDKMHDFDLNEIRRKLGRIAIQPNESA